MKTTKMLAILVLTICLITSSFAALPPGWYEFGLYESEPGSAYYDEESGEWVLKAGSSPGPWVPTHTVYTVLKGDGHISARVHNNQTSLEINGNSGGASMFINFRFGTGIIAEFKSWPDQTLPLVNPPIVSLPCWVKVERKGDRFTGYISTDGHPDSWRQVGSMMISTSMNAKACLVVHSSMLEEEEAAKFDYVTVGPDSVWTVTGNNMYSAMSCNVGIGTANPLAKLDVAGNIRISSSSGVALLELGQGLDYAEGFDVSSSCSIRPGTVLIIDADNPGKLMISNTAYDKKVAGIVAGAKGLGSGVRLGAGQFDFPVALAGRVYCNVDAIEETIEPGDLLTTSARPGYAAKATDYTRAQGAILGKAMQRLEKGKKGQILILVTLQ